MSNQGPDQGSLSQTATTDSPWHTLGSAEVLARLGTDSRTGLTGQEAFDRAKAHGPNRLAEMPPRSALRVFLTQFKSVLILVLLAAAGVAGAVGDLKDGLVILAVVTINAILGFYQEFRAERSLFALKEMLPRLARVRRGGALIQIPAEQLVPGDIVLLEAGERVPADGRIVLAVTLQIDESGLTGESQPVAKEADASVARGTALADQRNMAFMNSLVTRGRGEMAVTATGMATAMGRLSLELAQAEERPSPLQRQLDQAGKRLGAAALALVTLLFFFALLRGEPLAHVLIESVSLAVASIPEGLPAVVTVTLALGMRRMARKRAIIKRLASVETLGCATVICSDKTGTLTMNQMTARSILLGGERFLISGEGYHATGAIEGEHGAALPDLTPLLLPAALCNDSRLRDGELIGDPTEGALLALAAKGGINAADAVLRLPRIAEIPFDSAHKFMATFHDEGAEVRLFVKGAPDVLLEYCTGYYQRGDEVTLDVRLRQSVRAEYQELARQGLRGLLIASRTLPADQFDPAGELLNHVCNLTLIGLVGIMDPPRPEAKKAIASCRDAGIDVKMITGDHPDTAVAIARELGLAGRVLTGLDLDQMSASRLAAEIEDVSVFARVVPEHKVTIVRALRAKGHVVAMTGDGVNDAPALKNADIGVAMGVSGTEVAKEAATMVLTDDNFATIVGAVHEGRILYDNIIKFIRFQLSTTTGAMMVVFCAPLLGLPDPFTPIQILWVAMIMDGPPAVALALDAARPDIMLEPPRHQGEPILALHRLGKIFAFGALMTVGTLGVLNYGRSIGTEERALTLAFTTFVLFQVFNVFNARAERATSLNKQLFNNRMLWVSLASVIVLQLVAVYWTPAQKVVGTVPLSGADWAIACSVGASIFVLEEVRKLIARTSGLLSNKNR